MTFTALHSQIIERNWSLAYHTLSSNPQFARDFYTVSNVSNYSAINIRTINQKTHRKNEVYKLLPLHMALQGEGPDEFILLLMRSYPEAVVIKDPLLDEFPLITAKRHHFTKEVVKAMKTECMRKLPRKRSSRRRLSLISQQKEQAIRRSSNHSEKLLNLDDMFAEIKEREDAKRKARKVRFG
jgi:hypothetical protein